jgi:MoaA/NifB/PqqE/SkfB family radical SAM enzyme
MVLPDASSLNAQSTGELKKLWLYTNYDCNLSCSYCVAESTPQATRRSLTLAMVQRLCDEAAALGFEQVYFTGGEPFILPEIYPMLSYSSRRFETTVLTNGMLLYGRRLEQLKAVGNENLIVQISLDGATPEQHDRYRGQGSWAKTVAGLQALLEAGFRVRLATTQTSANSSHLDEMCAFHRALGIPEEDHIVRPLARRGFSKEGCEVGKHNLSPEITINVDGVYWHPLSTDPDMLVNEQIFPLAQVVDLMQAEYLRLQEAQAELQTFQ